MQLSGLNSMFCDGLASCLASHTENSMYVADCMTACQIIGARLANHRILKRQPGVVRSPLGYQAQFLSPKVGNSLPPAPWETEISKQTSILRIHTSLPTIPHCPARGRGLGFRRCMTLRAIRTASSFSFV